MLKSYMQKFRFDLAILKFSQKSFLHLMAIECHKESFANGRFMAINMVVLDDEHGFSSDIKKPLSNRGLV